MLTVFYSISRFFPCNHDLPIVIREAKLEYMMSRVDGKFEITFLREASHGQLLMQPYRPIKDIL